MEENKCIIVLSGGLYSTTVAYWAKNQGYDLRVLTFKYGQVTVKEVEYALKIAKN